MSRRKGASSPDIDDILGDILGDDDDPPPKKGPTSGRNTGARKKPGGEDSFYSSLTAEANESDGLGDTDGMFGGSSTRSKSTLETGFTTPAKIATSAKKSTIDFDDDDPLADLLSDDDEKPKKKPVPIQKSPVRDTKQEEVDRPKTGPRNEEEDTNSQSSRRLDIDRPPTRSGVRANTKKTLDDLFGDDDSDVLGGMGFDDSPKPTKKAVKQVDDEERGKGASILDDLLGKNTAAKHLERPGTSEKIEFTLDKKYLQGGLGGASAGGAAKKDKEVEEDFTFGAYNPSAASSRPSSSRPSSRRSVRFEDDSQPEDQPRTGSAPAGGRRGRGQASFLEDMLNKDDSDWLDMASGNKQEERPKSAGNVPARSDSDKKGSAEPVDWLGLSRMASPGEKETDKPKDEKPPRNSPTKEARKSSIDDDDDFLGLSGNTSRRSRSRPAAKSSDADDDWLGLGTGSSSRRDNLSRSKSPDKSTADDDWLGLGTSSTRRGDQSRSRSPEKSAAGDNDWLGLGTGSSSTKRENQSRSRSPEKSPSDKQDDWLGVGKDDETDDWLSATLKAKKEKKSSEDDWLGLDSKSDKTKETDNLEIGGQAFGSKSLPLKSKADERGLDLFTTPARRESATLPWDAELPRGRRGRPAGKARTPDVESEDDYQANIPKAPAAATVDQPTQSGEIKSRPSPLKSSSPIASQSEGDATSGMQIDTTSMFLQQQKQQEEMMRQQQQMMLEQQQKQQADMQRIMQEQQERARKQQEQQLKAMQESSQMMMGQNFASPFSLPQMPMSGGFGMSPISDVSHLQVQRLELEKKHLELMIETMKKQHEEEMKVLDNSFKKRTELLEETNNKRESRLKEENQILSEQNMASLKMVEQEKADLIAAHIKRQEEWQNEKQAETDRLREIHRQEMNALRNEHEETLERLKKAREQEVDTIAHTQSHTRNLQAVVSQLSDNAKELNDLQTKVDTRHASALDERESAAKSRDQQLKTLQERLERQQHDTEVERARLQGLVSKLEIQLTEQSRSSEEDKWKLRQEDIKLKTLQDNLSKEKDMMLSHVQRERADVQRAKEQLLDEQKSILGQLYEERRALADERAQFNLTQKLKMELDQRESLKTMRNGADVESSVKAINEEKARLTKIALEIQHDREKVEADKALLEQQKMSVHLEKEKLEQVALKVKQRSNDIEDMVMEAANAREDGERALAESRRLEADQSSRLASIQGQLQALRAKEKQIAQERIGLAKERQQFEQNRHSVLCVSCRTPIKDTPQPSEQVATPGKMTPAAANLYSALDPDLQNKVTSSIDKIARSIDVDRTVRKWRMDAEKDKSFLEEETYFLEALKHTPYHEPRTPKS